MTTGLAESNKQIVERAYLAMRDGDGASFLSVLSHDVIVTEPEFLPYGGICHGRSEFVAKLPIARSVMDSSRLTVHALTAEDDRVAAILSVGLAGSDDEVSISEHWRLDDGKAVEIRVFWAHAGPVPRGT